ncbi:MAG: hypothetical protein HQL08_11860 [Nitrospirae bacterium]|nr:hypothetical protein [Nitrospirota bacterium]
MSESIATMPTKKGGIKAPSSNPSITPSRKNIPLNLYVFTYLFIGMALCGSLASVVIPELAGHKPISHAELSLAFWIGITVTIIATEKGKSAWLWFLIGFLGIGFGTVFVLSVIMHFIMDHGGSHL